MENTLLVLVDDYFPPAHMNPRECQDRTIVTEVCSGIPQQLQGNR